MRYAKRRYDYVALDGALAPAVAGADRQLALGEGSGGSSGNLTDDTLSEFVRICQLLVPNVSHEKLVRCERTRTCTLVMSQHGQVVGGLTFRMVLVSPVPCTGAPRHERDPKLVLVLLLMAVKNGLQGRGIGSELVEYVRAIGMAHAHVQRAPNFQMAVQADNDAMRFWGRRGFVPGPEARRSLMALARWQPWENTVYDGATPMIATADVVSSAASSSCDTPSGTLWEQPVLAAGTPESPNCVISSTDSNTCGDNSDGNEGGSATVGAEASAARRSKAQSHPCLGACGRPDASVEDQGRRVRPRLRTQQFESGDSLLPPAQPSLLPPSLPSLYRLVESPPLPLLYQPVDIDTEAPSEGETAAVRAAAAADSTAASDGAAAADSTTASDGAAVSLDVTSSSPSILSPSPPTSAASSQDSLCPWPSAPPVSAPSCADDLPLGELRRRCVRCFASSLDGDAGPRRTRCGLCVRARAARLSVSSSASADHKRVQPRADTSSASPAPRDSLPLTIP
jgi:GNAT superfamily N-acetyltransferase